MSKRRASMREGPLADLFRATDEIDAVAPVTGNPLPLEVDDAPLTPPTPLPVRESLPFTPA